MMKILLFGASWQLGRQLQRKLQATGDLVAYGRKDPVNHVDFQAPMDLAAIVARHNPDVIVNAAAWTAVDAAEQQEAQADQVNATAPAVLAEAAGRHNALLIHYSTDYVFDGSGVKPWVETDRPAPLNAYGRSKLAGEQAILASGCRHFIFRTSWVFSHEGTNFLKTMLKLGQTQETLTIVSDQWGAPTSVELLSDVTNQAIALSQAGNTDITGLYHLAASGETNWYDYAVNIFFNARLRGIKLAVQDVIPVTTSVDPAKARRPLNSRLNTSKIQQDLGLNLPPWQRDVERVIARLSRGEE